MSLFTRTASLPLIIHAGATALAFAAFQGAKSVLDASYAASNHPVDYATGQTTFDAARIKGFYAHMQDLGTLDIYVRTQIIDFAFIGAVMVLGLLLGTLVARLGRKGGYGRRLGFVAAGLAMTGACMDAAENLVSFVMLANPQGFADVLALPYSAFASVKFAMLTLAMLSVLASIIAGLAERAFARLRPAT